MLYTKGKLPNWLALQSVPNQSKCLSHTPLVARSLQLAL